MTGPRWPNGARAACSFTFDLDAETLWMARGVSEPVALSTGQRAIQPPGPVLDGWLAELDGIGEAGGIANFTFHPQIIGRPSRLACLKRLIGHARATPGVWIARLDDVATRYGSGG
jgi:hypothetical protein